jgi:tetratricopeptide (TPR) repeat protein
MLTGEERAHMKSTGYREKYLIEAGLMEDPDKKDDKYDSNKNPEEKKAIGNIIKEHVNKKQEENIEITEIKSQANDMKTPEDKKEAVENEQLLLIRKVAQKIVPEIDENKVVEEEPIKFKTEIPKEIVKTEVQEIKEVKKETINTTEEKSIVVEPEIKEIEKQVVVVTPEIKKEIVQEEKVETHETPEVKTIENESVINTKIEISEKVEELRHEDEILKDLYNALSRHNKKQQERKEQRLRAKLGHSVLGKRDDDLNEPLINETEIAQKEETITEKSEQEFIDEVKKTLDNHVVEEKVINGIENQKLVEVDSKEQEETKNILITDESETDENLANMGLPKNEELIQEYREKIEGAVFDKSWDELISICNEAILALPFWDWAYYRRSTAWGNKREFEKVIEDCNKAVSYNPTLADAFYNRATARYFTGKYRDAADDYQKAIVLNYIKKADAFFNRGLCFQKMDHHKKAYLEFMKAKELGNKKAEEVLRNQYD